VTGEAQGILTVLVGAVVVRLAITGEMTNYVKPGLRWPLIATGAVLVVLGLWSFAVRVFAPHDAAHDEHDSHDVQGHAHGGRAPLVSWLLLVPTLTVVVVAPPPLGAAMAEIGTSPPPAVLEFSELPPDDPVALGVSDFVARALYDRGESLLGRRVQLTGFAVPTDRGWDLARLEMKCCAADARPRRITMTGAHAVASDTWVTVTGTWSPGGTATVPVLRVESVSETDRPANPYE
jgi:uncharacterized repeat protein (TIGR03943 family)